MAIRGQFTINGRSFAVADSAFIEYFSNGTSAPRGTVANDGLPVTMAASPQQLMVASGGTAYVMDLGTNAFAALPGSTFAGPVSQVNICTDFFLVLVKNSKNFYVSGALDANDWTSNGNALVDVFPDNIVSMYVINNQIWFFSDTQRAVYFESGNVFPFDYIQGSFGETGSAAQFSPVKLDGTLFWLGRDDRGQGVVYRAYGYNQQRVSDYAIEMAIQSYSRIDDAIAFGYQDQGHNFYVLYFPTPSKTWIYDPGMQMWHERGFWLTSIAQFRAAHYQNHTFSFGKHLVGDWQSNVIYEMHVPVLTNGIWSFADDDGNPIRRVRRSPHISNEQKYQFFSRLQVFVESGLGPMPPLQGILPATAIILQDSGGQNWAVQVQDDGELITSKVSGGTPQQIVLSDSSGQFSYLLGIFIGTDGKPRLTATAVSTSVSFTGSDVNPLPAPWVHIAGGGSFVPAKRLGNQVVCSVTGDCDSAFTANGTFTDQSAQIVVGSATNGYWGVGLRMNPATGSEYALYVFNDGEPAGMIGITISKVIAGVETILSFTSVTGTIATGDIIAGSVQGTTLQLSRNGSVIATASDSSLASGYFGFVLGTDSSPTDAGITSWQGSVLGLPAAVSSYQLISVGGIRQYFLGVIPAGNLETFPGGGIIIARGPVITMRWSDDGAHTWSNGYDRDCGQAGEYKKRVIWNRLGRGRDRVFEISTADPWGCRIIDGYVEYEQSAA